MDAIDAFIRDVYSERAMPVKNLQLGQLWRNDDNGRIYLVTKLYNEVFSQFAMLRPADASSSAESLRVKVQKTAEGATLPGYTFTQESQEF